MKILPNNKLGYRIEIAYGKFNNQYEYWEKSIIIYLDKNKKNAKCYGYDSDLCKKVELEYCK